MPFGITPIKESEHLRDEPLNWVSLKTGLKYSFEEYSNHGHGGIHRGKIDLPKDEYPYTIEYKPLKRKGWE